MKCNIEERTSEASGRHKHVRAVKPGAGIETGKAPGIAIPTTDWPLLRETDGERAVFAGHSP